MHSKEFIELIPLGGLGEFGMNMMVLRYGGHTIIIDSGLMFPDERLPGVEVIVPDISFLEHFCHLDPKSLSICFGCFVFFVNFLKDYTYYMYIYLYLI